MENPERNLDEVYKDYRNHLLRNLWRFCWKPRKLIQMLLQWKEVRKSVLEAKLAQSSAQKAKEEMRKDPKLLEFVKLLSQLPLSESESKKRLDWIRENPDAIKALKEGIIHGDTPIELEAQIWAQAALDESKRSRWETQLKSQGMLHEIFIAIFQELLRDVPMLREIPYHEILFRLLQGGDQIDSELVDALIIIRMIQEIQKNPEKPWFFVCVIDDTKIEEVLLEIREDHCHRLDPEAIEKLFNVDTKRRKENTEKPFQALGLPEAEEIVTVRFGGTLAKIEDSDKVRKLQVRIPRKNIFDKQ